MTDHEQNYQKQEKKLVPIVAHQYLPIMREQDPCQVMVRPAHQATEFYVAFLSVPSMCHRVLSPFHMAAVYFFLICKKVINTRTQMGRTRVWTTLTTFYPLDKPLLFWGGHWYSKEMDHYSFGGGCKNLERKTGKKGETNYCLQAQEGEHKKFAAGQQVVSSVVYLEPYFDLC